MDKHLIGYKAYWDDTYDAVVNDPIYSETPPPVNLREEYLGELAMRLWYLFVIEHKLRLSRITIKILTDTELVVSLTDGYHNAVYLRINHIALPFVEALANMWQGIISPVHMAFGKTLNETAIPLGFETKYEAWRREQ